MGVLVDALLRGLATRTDPALFIYHRLRMISSRESDERVMLHRSRYIRGFVALLPLLCLCAWAGCGDAYTLSDERVSVQEGVPADGITAMGTGGMVSSAHPLATEAGLAILRRGGNAFDAAVAVAAMLNVVEPNMSGVGGYGTILVYEAGADRVRFLNASGRIPAGLDGDVFRAPTPGYRRNRVGPKAISTPGNANAWQALSNAGGTLPWSDLMSAAIRAADGGFPVSPRLASSIAAAFEAFSPYAQSIYGPDGTPLAAGDTLVQHDLASTLRALVSEGPGAIHGGDVGALIDREMRRAGSFLTLADLRDQKAEWYEPIHISYRGYEVLTASPPATAFPSLVRLGLMSRFDVRALGHNTPAYLHLFAEVTKHAFWTRLRYAGDPDVHPPPLDTLLSEAYWQQQADRIDPDRAEPFVPPQEVAPGGMHTTHFVVADRWGNIVSATQTLGNAFGSRVLVEGTGIWLNNSLAYSTFEPEGNPMDAFPGRHKLSGDCPTIILRDGRPWAALGTPGGHTIGQTVPQMVMNLIDFDMDIQQAITAPRVSFIEPDILAVEDRIPEDTRSALADMGHHVESYRRLGNAHGITIEYDTDGLPVRFSGASDPRGEGLARGF